MQRLKIKGIASLLAVATAPLIINAGASRATLFIDLIEVSPTRTEVRASGSLNLTGLTSTNLSVNFGNPAARSGLNTNNDVTRFSELNASTPGRYYSISGIASPFTFDNANQPGCSATGNCLALASPAPSTTVPLFINAGSSTNANVPGSTIWLANSYASGGSILNSFFLDRSLAQLGLSTPTVTFTLAGSSETIVFREVPVPGPLPILGAATAFSFSRRLRSRVRSASKAEQSQQA